MADNIVRLAGVIKESIVDGPGIRMTVFTQGCPHHCEGCHNPETWDFEGGFDCEIEKLINTAKKDPLLQGLTFSGGEPFAQAKPLAKLAKMCHETDIMFSVTQVIHSKSWFLPLTLILNGKNFWRKLTILLMVPLFLLKEV